MVVGAEAELEHPLRLVLEPADLLDRVAGEPALGLGEIDDVVVERELVWLPQTEVEMPTDDAMQVMGLIEKLEDLDDVQSVASNLRITDEVAAALEAA